MLKGSVIFGEGAQAQKQSELVTNVMKDRGTGRAASTDDYMMSPTSITADAGKPSAPPKDEPVKTAVGKREAPVSVAVLPTLSPRDLEVPPNLAVVAPGAASAAASTRAGNTAIYDFLDKSRTDQQKVLTIIAKAYQSAHPDVSTEEAKAIVLKELAVANYYVDSHGTKVLADDTPLHVVEHVATR